MAIKIRDLVEGVADFIRNRESSTEPINVDVMLDRLNGLPSGGNTSIEDGLIENTLTEYTNSRIKTVGSYAFAYKTLTSVNLENVIEIKSNAFYNSTTINTVNTKNVITIGESAFAGCSALIKTYFPKVETIGNRIFWNGRNVKSILLGNAKSIGSMFLLAATNCNMLVLCGNQVCTLAGSLEGSFNADGKYIYVKRELITEYEIATNWSVYANQFRAIEDYLEDIIAVFPDFRTDFPQFFEEVA